MLVNSLEKKTSIHTYSGLYTIGINSDMHYDPEYSWEYHKYFVKLLVTIADITGVFTPGNTPKYGVYFAGTFVPYYLFVRFLRMLRF